MTRTHRLCCLLLLALACRAEDDARPWRVLAPRMLALHIAPAEAAPGERVTFSALAADSGGPLATEQLTVSFCRTPKQLGDNRFASDPCALRVEGAIAGTSATVPSDACSRFGPNVPAGVRPPDPDATGGYYQPVRIVLDDLSAVGALRLRCPLADAPLTITRAYRERYAPNRAPVLATLRITREGGELDPRAVPKDSELVLHSGWTASSEERYVVYDRVAAAVHEQSEALEIAWFVNAGELAADHTRARVAQNHFRTPAEPGPVYLWLVLRDDRGAQTFASYVLDVR